ncbi:hypothetical protein I7I53_09828 [Histoplasma capsulatum var. duboisii H88]|uniref:Uncharacterized protein n=1 Tax=Ajellomyces capsulatus (strain H88) TaxID=544711 RepID=A0A8A1LBR6_AJEC8|nr:hypothetical protein I7I53_09828 [Histoplasma capsulatum var. duboisii H88]
MFDTCRLRSNAGSKIHSQDRTFGGSRGFHNNSYQRPEVGKIGFNTLRQSRRSLPPTTQKYSK